VLGHRRTGAGLFVGAVIASVTLALPTTAAAGTSVNLDQWASTDNAWQNGNLNGNNSRYPEGGVVPFRLAMEGLKAGAHSITIQYDFTANGHKAYDFLATWNVTNAKGKICTPSGGAISSMCPSMPASSSAAFPSDAFKANGLSVSGAMTYSGSPRRLTIWGGTIISIGRVVHAGSVNANSTAEMLVHFRSTGSAVLLAWGGHLAQSRYWDTAAGGLRDGASLVSGAPWHVRTLQLDGAGNKNQDRSIQPSAIVGELPAQALAPPTPTPRPTPRPAAPTNRPTPPPNDPGAPTSTSGTTGARPTVPPTSTLPVGDVHGSPLAAIAYLGGLLATLVAVYLRGRRRSRSRDSG
jgi:hypothetical protein